MTIDERDRHELHNKLAEVLGTDEAATLMAHLPPGGSGEVATRGDVEALRAEIRHEFNLVRAEMVTKTDLHLAITAQTRLLAITIAGVSVAYAGLALGMLQAVRL